MRRRRLFAFAFGSLAAGSLALTVAVLVAPTASAEQSPASSYGVINATVNAATVHEIAGSTAFPNFTTGAVDNYYSLAHSAVDNSPFAEGTASPADTGPIGQTAAAGHFQQPQYADARWPDKSGKASYGSPGGPHAVATAASYDATAACSVASSEGGASPPGVAVPKGDSSKLAGALAAWKSKWLVPLKLKAPSTGSKPKVPVPVPSLPTPTVPTPTVPTVSTPTVSVPLPASKPSSQTTRSSSSRRLASSSGDGGALLESSSLATVDPHSGDVVTHGESRLGRVSLAKGQIVIHGIDVSVTVTNNGTPTAKVAVNVAAASIGGVPVTIDQDGVHVKGQGPNLPYAKADDALNAALKKAGIQVHTVAPEITKMPNEQTIIASGVHIGFVQPVDLPGVPSQYVDHILGEVFVDSLAAPAPPTPTLDLGSTGSLAGAGAGGSGSGSGSGGTAFGSGSSSGSAGLAGGGSPSSSGYSSQPVSGGSAVQAAPASSGLTSLAHKPVWLLAAFLVWQALMIGTGISLRYWQMGGAS